MRSIDIKIEQARKRAEAEKNRQPMTNPPKSGLTDIVKTPRYDPAKPMGTPKSSTSTTEDDGDWDICCTAVTWFVKHNRSNP